MQIYCVMSWLSRLLCFAFRRQVERSLSGARQKTRNLTKAKITKIDFSKGRIRPFESQKSQYLW